MHELTRQRPPPHKRPCTFAPGAHTGTSCLCGPQLPVAASLLNFPLVLKLSFVFANSFPAWDTSPPVPQEGSLWLNGVPPAFQPQAPLSVSFQGAEDRGTGSLQV